MENKISKYLLTPNDYEFEFSNELLGYSVVFISGLSDRDVCEMAGRGYISHIYIANKIENIFWPLCFYDSVRLTQDLEIEGYISDIGLIVVKEVTKTVVLETCVILLRDNYTKNHKGYTLDEIKYLFHMD
ncbi:hypothetical protein FACS1894170_07110 [Planctomycetales bacterium]|nr:hypothetical protein FACS1894170_07110 [Planctomycetales bacterium]